jgi:hypothetical protein
VLSFFEILMFELWYGSLVISDVSVRASSSVKWVTSFESTEKRRLLNLSFLFRES